MTMMAMSVTAAPLALISLKALWPGVSRKVTKLPASVPLLFFFFAAAFFFFFFFVVDPPLFA